MDRRCCLQALTTASAVAWLPGAAFAKVPILTTVNVPSSSHNIPVLGSQTVAPDPLYVQAVAVVMTHKKPSISLVQRHLLLQYSRAVGLVASMEQAGLISTYYVNGYLRIRDPAST